MIKKDIAITKTFQEILDEPSKRKQNVIENLNGEEIIGTLYKKQLQKAN